jgi:hypothetical protein
MKNEEIDKLIKEKLERSYSDFEEKDWLRFEKKLDDPGFSKKTFILFFSLLAVIVLLVGYSLLNNTNELNVKKITPVENSLSVKNNNETYEKGNKSRLMTSKASNNAFHKNDKRSDISKPDAKSKVSISISASNSKNEVLIDKNNLSKNIPTSSKKMTLNSLETNNTAKITKSISAVNKKDSILSIASGSKVVIITNTLKSSIKKTYDSFNLNLGYPANDTSESFSSITNSPLRNYKFDNSALSNNLKIIPSINFNLYSLDIFMDSLLIKKTSYEGLKKNSSMDSSKNKLKFFGGIEGNLLLSWKTINSTDSAFTYLNKRRSEEKNIVLPSAMLTVGAKLNHWVLESGIGINSYGEKIAYLPIQITKRFMYDSIVVIIIDSSQTQYDTIKITKTIHSQNDSVTKRNGNTIINQISVPILLGYSKNLGKLLFSGLMGINLNYTFEKRGVYINQSVNELDDWNTTNLIRSFFISFHAQVQEGYRFGRNEIFISQSFYWQLNNALNSATVSQHYLQTGFGLGMNHSF